MNCLEFQRELNANPRALGAAAHAHAAACPACRERLNRAGHFEARLSDALAIAPPPGLEDRILLRVRLGQRRRLLRPALAASLAVLALGALLLLRETSHGQPLHLLMAEHVLHEPRLFHANNAPDEDSVRRRLATIGAHPRAILPVPMLEPCDVPGGGGAHLVLAMPEGRVVMTLIPHSDAPEARATHSGLVSVVRAAPRGRYALAAHDEAALDSAERLLREQVSWRI